MKKLIVLILLLSLAVAMSGTVLGAVQYVEGLNASYPVNTSANYEVGGYVYGVKYVPTVSYSLKKVELMAGEGTGPFTVQLRPNSGGYPSSTILLATTFTMVNTVSWQGAEFSSSYPLVAGAAYWIVFKPVPGSQASIAMGSATPITAVYDNPSTGPGWDGYIISYFNGLPLPWMAKFYKDTGTPGYSVTITASDYLQGSVSVPITKDGVSTGYTTPHTFTGLTGTHTFTVPSTDSAGHPFSDWNTGWTDRTITVSSAGTYTANYRAGYSATIWSWCTDGWLATPITKDGVSTGYTTPHTFTGLTGTHTFTVPATQGKYTFYEWSTGTTSRTLTITSAGVYTARYRPGSITVTSPNGGQQWVRGTYHSITWTSAGNPGANVKIELLKGGAVNRVISSSTANDGSYGWTIPSTQTLGTDYKIRITSTTISVCTDSSNSNFAITAGALTVTSPNGGQNWARGSVHSITWTSVGSPGAYVKIELLKGGVVNLVISSSTANDGSYSWTIPSTQTVGTDYKIRITSTSITSITDSSNSNFQIS